MRPCENCGTPITNDLLLCTGCQSRCEPPNQVKCVTEHPAEVVDEESESDRAEVRKFVTWTFGIFVVFFPALGYVLGGTVIAIICGFLGCFIFAMLESFTH